MATRTFGVNRDARVGTNGSSDLGAGACDHLPVGEGGGYEYRSFIKFDNDWSDMTDISQIRLYLTNDDDSSSTDHLVRGSTSGARKFYVDRVTEGWSAGTASHPMTSSNGSISSGGSMVYPGPSCSTSGDNRQGPFTATDVDNDQQSWDITDLYRLLVPSSIYVSGASTPTYGSGNDNYGIRLIREDSSDTVEFWSSEKGGTSKVPKIVVTYTNNNLPTCTITSPTDSQVLTGGTTYATPSITVGATCTDADGDAITNIQFEFDTTADFASPFLTSTANDDTAGVVSRVISDASLPRGTTIYVRGRASDATGYGDWSTTVEFAINNATAPSITGTAGTVMELTVEGTDTGPRAVVRFTYSDPEGDTISRYTARLYDSTNTTALSSLVDESVTEVPEYVKLDYTGLVHGTTYVFRVQTYDADGLSTGVVTQSRVAKWAVRDEYYVLSAPNAWNTNTVAVTPTDTKVIVQHGTQTASSTTTPTNWTTELGDLSLTSITSYWARFWLFAYNGAATSGVEVTSHTLTYTSSSLTADGWTMGTGASVTTSKSWYGTRCLRIDGTGAGGTTRSASISVSGFKVGQPYTISCRLFQSGAASAFLRLKNGSTSIRSAGLLDVDEPDASTADFVYTWDTLESAPAETLTVQCDMTGASGTYALFDAVKVEQGTVATPWTPSVLSRAVVVDGNGLQVDGRGGGVVRFRGTDTSSTEAEVDLIDRGLRFSSPLTMKEISAPSNPASGYRRLYLKSDGTLYLKNSAGTETAVGGGVSDHGALTGLGDDDHTQYVLKSLVDAKGDLLTATADNTPARLAVGTNTYHLVADSGQATGLKWDRPYFYVGVWWTESSLVASGTKNLDLAYPTMPNFWTPEGLPGDMSIIYMTVRVSSPRTGGTSVFQIYDNDTASSTGPTLTLNASATNYDSAGPYAIGTYTIPSDHSITLRQTATGTYGPTGVNVAGLVVFAIPII